MGVFAIKEIPEGIDPFPDAGHDGEIIVPHGELQKLNSEVRQLVYDTYYSNGDGVHIPHANNLPITPNATGIPYRINHCEDPNLQWDFDSETFISTRRIGVGEELFIDYSFYDEGE